MKYSEDELIRARTLSDTLFFTRYFFKKRQKRKFVVNWHHKQIAEKLDKVYSGEIKKLIVRIPPRYGKTELAVKNFIAKGLAINPQSKFIHLSYSSGLALDNSEEVRDFITDEHYSSVFPYVNLSTSSKAKNKWYTTEGGGVYATATGGQITGFGAGKVDEEELNDALDELKKSNTFAGAIVIDDPLKPDDADSELKRERVNHRFENTIRSRVNSRNTPIIIIGQSVHERDLAGYLIEQEPDEWDVLTLPAILNEDQEDECALWEFKQTLEELKKIKEADKRTFNTQYQQNPTDEEGKLIPKTAITLNTFKDEQPLESLAFFDPADKGGDRLSGVFIDVIEFGDKVKFYLNDVIHTTDGIDATCERIPLYVGNNKTEQIYVESNGLGIALIKGFKRELDSDTTKIKPIHQSMDKEARILGNYEKIISHFIFKNEEDQSKEYKEFVNHLTAYSREGTNTHKKDAIDVASFAASILFIKYKKTIFA